MKTILLADNSPSSRRSLKESLSTKYIVLEAKNKPEIFEKAKTARPDLIIIDMEKCIQYGPTLCAQLKCDKNTMNIPLILLFRQDQGKEIISGLDAGAEDYMTKPVDAYELITRIDTHLRTKEYYNDLEKKDLLVLLELTEALSVTRNPKKILKLIVEKMVEVIDVSRCSIINMNHEGELVVLASTDLSFGQEIKLDLKNYPEIEEALTLKRPVVIQDLQNSGLMSPVKEKIKNISDKAIFVVPIIKKQNVIGTFFMRSGSPLMGGITEKIFKFCQVVANISGNALESAVLFESMQIAKVALEELSNRDSLTNLHNHQFFHQRFEFEFSRSQRYQQNLSCIFIDLDDFKRINDKYGHIAGDIALKKVGRLISKVLRKSDIASRYGGEEFAVLLTNTDREGANEFAVRLASLLRELDIQQLKGERLTASMGIATFTQKNVASYDALLHSADEAMYQAKNSGKDKIFHAVIGDQQTDASQ